MVLIFSLIFLLLTLRASLKIYKTGNRLTFDSAAMGVISLSTFLIIFYEFIVPFPLVYHFASVVISLMDGMIVFAFAKKIFYSQSNSHMLIMFRILLVLVITINLFLTIYVWYYSVALYSCEDKSYTRAFLYVK